MESQLLAYAQMRRLRILHLNEIPGLLRITRQQAARLLSRLSKASLIARVSRGLYLVPPRLPLGGSWSPDEALALTTLLENRHGRYQICGPNAFNRYGFVSQVPAQIYAYNNRFSGYRRIGAVALRLIKVGAERLGETEREQTADGLTLLYSSRVRTLVDAVYDWSRFNSLPRGFDWIRSELGAKRVRAADLVRVLLRYGDIGTVRRIGALLDRDAADGALLTRLEQKLTRSSGLIPWIPTRPKRGTIDRRWGVVWNDRLQ